MAKFVKKLKRKSLQYIFTLYLCIPRGFGVGGGVGDGDGKDG